MNSSWNQRFRIMSSITGALTGLGVAGVAICRPLLSPEMMFYSFVSVIACFIIAMVMLVMALITSPQLMVKLSALPILYVVVVLFYLDKQMKIVNHFKAMMGLDIPPEALEVNMAHFGETMALVHGGVLVMTVPIIIVAVVKMMGLNRGMRQDFSTFDRAKGQILNVEDTMLRVNQIHVYKVTLQISYYQGRSYEVSKEFRVPYHLLHSIAIGQEVTVLINPKKQKDVFIETEYGVI